MQRLAEVQTFLSLTAAPVPEIAPQDLRWRLYYGLHIKNGCLQCDAALDPQLMFPQVWNKHQTFCYSTKPNRGFT